MKIRIAIDPGKGGAVAVDMAGKVYAENCPENEHEMSGIIRDAVSQSDDVYCIIEQVGAMPGQGVTSMFTFGRNFGGWLGILAALQVPFITVRPQAWQKVIGGLPKDKAERKRRIKAYAAARYPHIKVTLKNADALAMLSVIEKGRLIMNNQDLTVGKIVPLGNSKPFGRALPVDLSQASMKELFNEIGERVVEGVKAGEYEIKSVDKHTVDFTVNDMKVSMMFMCDKNSSYFHVFDVYHNATHDTGAVYDILKPIKDQQTRDDREKLFQQLKAEFEPETEGGAVLEDFNKSDKRR